MSSNWQTYSTSTPSIVLPGVADGRYEIEVVAIDAFGNRSDPFVPPTQEVDRSATGVIGIDGSVERVMDAAVVALGEWVVQASWAQVDNDSLSVAIRHSPDISGATWSTSNPLVKGETPNAEGQMLLPALTGTYLFRHQNGSGAVSLTTPVVFHVPESAVEVIATIDEAATGFTGVKRNCAFDASIQALRLNDEYWDDLALDGDFDALPGPIDEYGAPRVDTNTWDDLAQDGNFDGLPGPIDDYGFDSKRATYYFANDFDAGAVKDLQLSRIIRSRSRLVATSWDSFLGPVDEILSIDNATAESGIVQLEYQDSNDALNSGLAGSWSGWKPLTRSVVRARSVRFRALLSVADINQDVVVTSLAVQVAVAASLNSNAAQTTYTTAALAQNEAADFAMELGKLSMLKAVQISEPSWIRFYRSSEQRASDPRTSPGGNIQTMINLQDKKPYGEGVTTLALETLIPSGIPSLLGDTAGFVYVRLVKQSAETGPVTIITTSVPLEN